MSARDRILGRARAAPMFRQPYEHPGDFGAWRPHPLPRRIDGFKTFFGAAGGEIVEAADVPEATEWIRSFAADFATVTCGETVPDAFRPELPVVRADEAEMAVSMAWGAVAETGSLMMDARDGRRSQLLADTHIVVLHASRIFGTLAEAFVTAQEDLPSAIGLHSGPSKSADIGQVMVKGVHGPGRVIAVVIG